MKKGIMIMLAILLLLTGCKKKEQFYYYTKEETVIDYLNYCRKKKESDYCVRFDAELDRFENEVEMVVYSTYVVVHLTEKEKEFPYKKRYELLFTNNAIKCEDKKGDTIYYNFRK